ncbi:hypothetical protein TcYC6_0044920 [Trypanosoma cruzi]|nr:hypothetical protein TcYC6_0044920 [Trypanosoma cruzi]
MLGAGLGCPDLVAFLVQLYRCVHGLFKRFSVIFVTAVALGERIVNFFPSSLDRVATDHLKVAQVELDAINKCIHLQIMNTTPEDALHILKGLPLSLEQWTTTREGSFCFPIDVLDMLVHELRMLSGTKGNRLYVNDPSNRCREAALLQGYPIHSLSELYQRDCILHYINIKLME